MGVLCQQHGPPPRILAYLSKQLDVTVLVSVDVCSEPPSKSHVNSFMWVFVVHEAYQDDSIEKTHVAGKGYCAIKGCQSQLSINFFPGTLKSITIRSSVKFLCFLFDQTEKYCHQWPDTYGGCPYSSCKMHLPLDWNAELSLDRTGMFIRKGRGTYRFNIADPGMTDGDQELQESYILGSIVVSPPASLESTSSI
ncbi:putative endogenous retrovirus group FC1 Env polyprotein [Tenrec ecaudatus]|uniref:putative endogenous retrovirus group FC1 Env polyprotein n=1 Tax=Tenrec ecaudatus TaxID=94439 RepID=UPI003F59CBBA